MQPVEIQAALAGSGPWAAIVNLREDGVTNIQYTEVIIVKVTCEPTHSSTVTMANFQLLAILKHECREQAQALSPRRSTGACAAAAQARTLIID
jgi:hypothetical protein